MPAITDYNSTVLVTGSNGFVGTWIVGTLLARGYHVRAAVRTEAKGDHLLKIYKPYGHKLTIHAVGNMDVEGAWDKAVQGVDGVIHAAADVHLNAKTPQEVIEPAVKGVLGILESVRKHGTTVKRVVFTSSCVTIKAFTLVPMTLSEEDWNDAAVKECDEKGAEASPLDMYSASKTIAEKKGWEWYNEHQSELDWDIVTILPPWIFGPVKHEVNSIEELNGSNRAFYNATVLGDFMGMSPLTTPSHGFSDVRDVAEGLVRALETPEAGGERILLVQSRYVWQDTIDAMNSVVPSPWKSHNAPFAKGEPKGERVRNITWIVEKEKRIFGMKFRSLQETARDILEDYEAHGWV